MAHNGAAAPAPPVVEPLVKDADRSPIERIRTRKPAVPRPGEIGQVKSFYYNRLMYLGDPNPDELDVDTYRKMELDPQVRAGIIIRELAILGKSPTFNFKTGDNAGPAEEKRGHLMTRFLSWVWQNLEPGSTEVLRNLLTARRFGFAVMEKVWASEADPVSGTPRLALLPPTNARFAGFAYISKLKLLPPESVESAGFATDQFGNLLAVHQNIPATWMFSKRDPDDPRFLLAEPIYGRDLGRITFAGPDLDRLIVYVVRREHGNYYGQSDHKAAYQHWYAKQAIHAARNVYLEITGGVLLGEYSNANEQAALESAADNAGPGAVVTIPMGTKLAPMQGWENAVQGFQEAIRYDDIQILRAYLVPNETVGGSGEDVGSFARSVSHFESFILSVRHIQLELEEVIERQFIRPLIDANFGPQESYPTFDFPEMVEKDREQLVRIWSQAVTDGYVDPAVDAAWLRREMGVPEDAPEGHIFQRPAVGPPSLPNTPSLADNDGPPLPYPTFAALAQEPTEGFMATDTPRSNALLIERLESKTRSVLADALSQVQSLLQQSIPDDASEDELSKLDVPADVFQHVFDQLAVEVLDIVRADMADKFEAIGGIEVAAALRKVRPLAPGTPAKAMGVLRGLAESVAESSVLDALNAYMAWSAALNRTRSDDLARDLAARLRIRALHAFRQGVEPRVIARTLSEEFASYSLTQLQTVSRTTVMDLFNSSRNATFDAAGDFVEGVRFVGVRDARQTPFCRSINGRSIRKSDQMYEQLRHAPFDYGCRTAVFPVLASERHDFDTDWPAWLQRHANDKGAGFLFGVAA